METQSSDQTQKPATYPDPTKPKYKEIHEGLSKGWIIFIGFNIALPVMFAIAYLWMNKGS